MMDDDTDFFARPSFWFHLKKLLMWPMNYFKYRRRLTLAQREFERQALLAINPKVIQDFRHEQRLERIARDIYEKGVN